MRLMTALPLLALNVVLLAPGAQMQTGSSPAPEAGAILSMLHKQETDWNRGDLNAFATGYKNSAHILFMGKTIRHGYAQMLAGYRKSYPTRAAMGTLSFSELAVQPLDSHFATVTGRFHLERTATGGGDAGGYYLLVVEKTSAGWKIVRDDTSGEAPQH